MTLQQITIILISGLGIALGLIWSTLRKTPTQEKLLLLLEQHYSRQQTDLLKAINENQQNGFKQTQENLHLGMTQIRQQVTDALTQSSILASQQAQQLTQEIQQRLQEISGQVDKRLADGFDKTTATFVDIVKRLAMIDEAQKKITELSSNVVSLQSLLNDKRSRGAFGEVQLSALIRNLLPESNIRFQHPLSNGKRVDCMLLLPEPTGNIPIDAKFPLENYHKLISPEYLDKKSIEQQFRIDIRKHIEDIADKYIIAGETADGAMLFLPAEAIFAEIHSRFNDLVEYANQRRVWLVSPTTMMAIVTTARAVLKDAATRKQVHVIQEHLAYLAKDFTRFQKRMDSLAKHIGQAKEDVDDVNTSARKLTSRFEKIEKVEYADVQELID